MRKARRALSVRQAIICRLKVLRLSCQCVAHRNHSYDIQPTPLSVWFWGAYLVTTQTPGQSALQFQRQLGLSRYETAFQLLHKLRAGLVRPERDAIGDQHPVEVDEALVGGRTRGEGRGNHHKTTVVGAIEVRTRRPAAEGKKQKRIIYAGRLRLRLVQDRGAKE